MLSEFSFCEKHDVAFNKTPRGSPIQMMNDSKETSVVLCCLMSHVVKMDLVGHLFNKLNICSTNWEIVSWWPVCVCVCVSVCVCLFVILPPSLNLPLLLLWDWAGSDGLNTACSGVRVAYMHYLGNELISRYSETACDRLRNLKPQRISLSRVWNLSHGGGSLQGKSCRAFFPSWQFFSRPLNCTKKVTRVPVMNAFINCSSSHLRCRVFWE